MALESLWKTVSIVSSSIWGLLISAVSFSRSCLKSGSPQMQNHLNVLLRMHVLRVHWLWLGVRINTFFNKWVKSFKPGYVPEKNGVLLRYLHSALKCFLGLCGHCLRPFVQHYNMAKVFWLDELKTTFSAYYHDIMTYLHDKLQLSNDISLSEVNLRTYLNKLTVLPGFSLNFSCAKLNSWCLALLSRVNILLHAHFHRLR